MVTYRLMKGALMRPTGSGRIRRAGRTEGTRLELRQAF
jgi:hypothetical protein